MAAAGTNCSANAAPRMAGAFLLLLVTAAAPAVFASQDPALCAFELGYNPTFNADGSQLSCTKGSESFVVDPQGLNARSLRGIGRSSLALSIAATTLDFVTFDKLVVDDAVFALPDGTVHSNNDPALRDFNLSFRFAPGVDVNTISDLSRYTFLGGNPLKGFVHVKQTTLNFDLEFDSVWRFNDAGGFWQLVQTYNVVQTPK